MKGRTEDRARLKNDEQRKRRGVQRGSPWPHRLTVFVHGHVQPPLTHVIQAFTALSTQPRRWHGCDSPSRRILSKGFGEDVEKDSVQGFHGHKG